MLLIEPRGASARAPSCADAKRDDWSFVAVFIASCANSFYLGFSPLVQ